MIRHLSATLAALAIATPLQAQFDTPSFLPPRPGDDVGVYLSDVGNADWAIQGIWRQGGNMNLGLRVGYIDIGEDGAVVVGAETWDLLIAAGNELPVDVSWTLGAGAAFNGGTLLEVPAGITIGRVLELDPMTIQVYAHPRIALFIEPDAEDELSIDGLFDIGADAVLNENLKLRLGATLGVIDAVGIGLAFRWSRGAVVR